MTLRIGLEHLCHGGGAAFRPGTEEREGFRVDAQMHRGLAGCGGVHDPGTAPESLVRLDLGRIGLGRCRQARGPIHLILCEDRLVSVFATISFSGRSMIKRVGGRFASRVHLAGGSAKTVPSSIRFNRRRGRRGGGRSA